jgi:Flp pilus assembly protein TadD
VILPVNTSAGDNGVTRRTIAKAGGIWHVRAMKLFCATVVLLAVLILSARAQQADDRYIGIYGALQQADSLAESAAPAEALAAYTDVQNQLAQFQKSFPDWNPKIIMFRLNQVTDKIADLKQKVSVQPAAPKKSETPAPPLPNVMVAAPPSPADQLDNLRTQLQVAQTANELLQAKLKEALSVQPAAVDPQQLAQAQDKIRELMKELELLKASPPGAGANPLPATAVIITNYLTQTNFATVTVTNVVGAPALVTVTNLVTFYQTNTQILKITNYTTVAAGAVDANALEMMKLDLAAAVKNFNDEHARSEELADQLARLKNPAAPAAATTNAAMLQMQLAAAYLERDALTEKLKQAQAAATATAPAPTSLAPATEETKVLRARLAVLEAQPVPYSSDELALFQAGAPAANPAAEKKSINEMPPGTAELVASAQDHFSHQEFDAAEADYLKILEHDQNNAIALANLATIELQQGKIDDAAKHIATAVKASPDDAYNQSTLGYLKFRQEKYDEALNALSRAAQLDPNNPEIQNYLGVTLSHQGQRKAAESALRRAIQLNPRYAPAHNNLAVLYLSQDPPLAELARWHYQKALDAGQPRNPDLEKMLADKGVPAAQ